MKVFDNAFSPIIIYNFNKVNFLISLYRLRISRSEEKH